MNGYLIVGREQTDGRIARRPRLGARHGLEEAGELVVQQRDVSTAKDLGDEGAAWSEGVQGDVERGEEELSLHVLV